MTDLTAPADTQLRIAPIVVPETLDAAEARPFLELVRLNNAVCRAQTGHSDLDRDPQEELGFWRSTTDRTTLGWYVERDGRIVGAVTERISTEPTAKTAEFDLVVEPGFEGQGIEELLFDAAEGAAREHGRGIVQTWSLHRPHQDGRRLEPSTGWGSIPADDPQTQVMLDHGYTLEQVERNSVFDLHGSFEVVDQKLADALAFAGDDYRLVEWTSPTPPERRDSFAAVLARMATDVPAGGLEIDEETWDAERVVRRDARMQDQGFLVSVAAVEHIPTGSLVAYNELVIASDRAGVTHQFGTLVSIEHRGRRLGTIVKCGNLVRWRDLVPESPRVSTFNAEENRPMLDINEAIGFVPASYAGAWKKVLG